MRLLVHVEHSACGRGWLFHHIGDRSDGQEERAERMDIDSGAYWAEAGNEMGNQTGIQASDLQEIVEQPLEEEVLQPRDDPSQAKRAK
jgi:hypothetical protein